jgi:hypothetical protein
MADKMIIRINNFGSPPKSVGSIHNPAFTESDFEALPA